MTGHGQSSTAAPPVMAAPILHLVTPNFTGSSTRSTRLPRLLSDTELIPTATTTELVVIIQSYGTRTLAAVLQMFIFIIKQLPVFMFIRLIVRTKPLWIIFTVQEMAVVPTATATSGACLTTGSEA